MLHALLPVLITLLFIAPAQAGDRTGGYFGGQTSLRNSAPGTKSGTAQYGIHGGYDIDFGWLVLGGELEFERLNLVQNSSGARLTSVGRLKLRAGGDFGFGMAYAIVGGVNGDTKTGRETGVVFGLGLLTTLNDSVIISGEALRQDFSDFAGSGQDLHTNNFNIRVSFRF